LQVIIPGSHYSKPARQQQAALQVNPHLSEFS